MICDMYERHTLLNSLYACRKFYTATRKEGERVLEFSARIRQLASALKSMSVTVDNNELAMALLNGLLKIDNLISALDAIGDEGQIFTFEFVSSLCEQEEQRQSQRHTQAIAKSKTAALLEFKSKSEDEMCIQCNKHRNGNQCYRKYPHLAHKNQLFRNRKALVGKTTTIDWNSDSDEVCLFYIPRITELNCCNSIKPVDYINDQSLASSCHLGMPSTPNFLSLVSCLAASDQSKNCFSWILGSGCTSHMTFDRSAFTSYSTISPVSVDFGAECNAHIIGIGSIEI